MPLTILNPSQRTAQDEPCERMHENLRRGEWPTFELSRAGTVKHRANRNDSIRPGKLARLRQAEATTSVPLPTRAPPGEFDA